MGPDVLRKVSMNDILSAGMAEPGLALGELAGLSAEESDVL